MIPGTLRELFTHGDWARDRLLAAAAERTDEELDRPFEVGEGSLRKTIFHLWGAEDCWLSRWKGLPCEGLEETLTLADLGNRFRDTAAQRERWLEGHDAVSLAQNFSYPRPSWWPEPGPDLELPRDVSVLHVLNHGVHHRAQAVNMLKRLGASPPALDYIVMRREGEPPDPPLDLATIRRYLSHGDWAYRQVHQAAAGLSDGARNQELPIGPGTLRRIMRHLGDAPDWWMDSIHDGPGRTFPAIEETDSWDELWIRYARAARRRDSYLDSLQDADLQRAVPVTPRSGVQRSFPLGVAMVQLCVHGTHHRAQALNMLRHSGAEVPSLDVAVWQRQGVPAVL